MWYYVQNGQQSGPIPKEELQQKLQSELPPSTLVWKEGMAEWVKADTLDAFSTNHTLSSPASVTAVGSTEPVSISPVSDTNPYTAPSSAASPMAATANATDIPDQPIPLDIGFCVKQGWRTTTNNFGNVFLLWFVYIAIIFVIELIFGAIGSAIDGPQTAAQLSNYEGMDPSEAFLTSMAEADQTGIAGSLLGYVSQIIQTFLGLGATAFGLALLRGQETNIGMLYSQSGSKLFKVIVASILYYLMVFVGLLLLVIPGIYLGIRYMHYQTAIVDKDLGIIESLNYSSKLTRDNKLSLFGLGIISFLICVAGFICLLVGLIWALPTVWLATLIAYCYLHNGEKSIVTYD